MNDKFQSTNDKRLIKEKAIIWLDRAMEFSICGLIFTLPFSKSLIEIFFVTAFACWIMKRVIISRPQTIDHRPQTTDHRPKTEGKISTLLKSFKPVKTFLNVPIGVFVFIGFLSTVNSVSLPLSLEGFFLKIFEWIMIYFIVAEAIDTKRKLNRILIVLLFSMALIGIDGIFQLTTGSDFIRGYPVFGDRIGGSFQSPNSFAGWLLIMAPLALSLASFVKNNQFNLPDRFKGIIKPALWTLAALLITCITLTYTRGAWIAFVLSLVFLGISRSKKILIVTLIILFVLPFISPDSIKRRAGLMGGNTETGILYRRDLWRQAWGIIEDFPLVGCGLNTYAIVGHKYKVTAVSDSYPHNSYLHMAAESGLLGLGAFLWIIVILFKTSSANLKRIQNGLHSAVLIGLLTGLFGFLVHSFFDSNIYTLQLGNLMWFVMGLIIAVQRVFL